MTATFGRALPENLTGVPAENSNPSYTRTRYVVFVVVFKLKIIIGHFRFQPKNPSNV